MKVLVLFGSESDGNIANPLVERLMKDHQAEYRVLSAHRDPEPLAQLLKTWQGDFIMAGAGIAAALPGVVASLSHFPVMGIPVSAQFGGIDALASIVQTPFKCPVMTCGPDNENEFFPFIEEMEKRKGVDLKALRLVVHPSQIETPYFKNEADRLKDLALEKNIELYSSSHPDGLENEEGMIVFSHEDQFTFPHTFSLHVPLLNDEDKHKPQVFMSLFERMRHSCLWVGANNSRNALLAFERIFSKRNQ